MKTTQTRAGKKIKGRKRHIVVDTIGLADVHSASVQDRDGIFLFKLNANLRKFFADQGYIGKLQNHCLLGNVQKSIGVKLREYAQYSNHLR